MHNLARARSHRLVLGAICGAAALAIGCASTASFETGRAYPSGDGAVILGVDIGWQPKPRAQPRPASSNQLPWLPVQVKLLARVVFGIGGDSETDITLSAPLWMGPHTPLGVGLSAGLKSSLVGADDGALALAAGARVGADVLTTMRGRGYRLWAQARGVTSWHPGMDDAGYATPYALAEWTSIEYRDSESLEHAASVRALSYGVNAGWMHRRATNGTQYFGETGLLWTPGVGLSGTVRGACADCAGDP